MGSSSSSPAYSVSLSEETKRLSPEEIMEIIARDPDSLRPSELSPKDKNHLLSKIIQLSDAYFVETNNVRTLTTFLKQLFQGMNSIEVENTFKAIKSPLKVKYPYKLGTVNPLIAALAYNNMISLQSILSALPRENLYQVVTIKPKFWEHQTSSYHGREMGCFLCQLSYTFSHAESKEEAIRINKILDIIFRRFSSDEIIQAKRITWEDYYNDSIGYFLFSDYSLRNHLLNYSLYITIFNKFNEEEIDSITVKYTRDLPPPEIGSIDTLIDHLHSLFSSAIEELNAGKKLLFLGSLESFYSMLALLSTRYPIKFSGLIEQLPPEKINKLRMQELIDESEAIRQANNILSDDPHCVSSADILKLQEQALSIVFEHTQLLARKIKNPGLHQFGTFAGSSTNASTSTTEQAQHIARQDH